MNRLTNTRRIAWQDDISPVAIARKREGRHGAVSIWDSGQLSAAHIVSAAGAVLGTWHIA